MYSLHSVTPLTVTLFFNAFSKLTVNGFSKCAAMTGWRLGYLHAPAEVFRAVSYDGEESISYSDAACLDMPMAVLINNSSYSAAEFFAAALQEYDKAIVVGVATTGKGYFQNTIELSDGSAVGLSVGKYYTPKGVSLAETGGLKPDVEQKLEEEKETKLYAGVLDPQEDEQVSAAIQALKKAG